MIEIAADDSGGLNESGADDEFGRSERPGLGPL